ncbi:MAG: uroporphyrinogen-III C-methyltransferase [Mobilitalea sp.]
MSIVYLIGAGPGDPGLITVKGLEYLKTCDAVIYDRLVSEQLLGYLKKDCVRIYVGKESGKHSKTQEEINRILIESTLSYEKIVRLKGGDPFVFGRGGEETQELTKHQIPFEVVPGVTSAIAVPSSAGIPVTHRGISRSFHVITGHTIDSENTLTDNYEVLAKLDGTLIFLMGLAALEQITEQLIQHGKAADTPAAVISNGTMINERTVRGTLNNITEKVKGAEISSPAIFVVGEVAALEYKQNYNLPLSEISFGITGTEHFREKVESGLRLLGAKTTTICDMKVQETEHIHQLEEELKYLTEYQWVIFTSTNAVRLFFETMQRMHIDRRKLSSISFAVIGSGTGQALEQYGYIADFIPERYNSSELAAEFAAIVVNKNDRVLIPRALQGMDELTKILDAYKIEYTEIPIYDVTGGMIEQKEKLNSLDCLIFASVSGVNAFFEDLNKSGIILAEDMVIACLGEATAAALQQYSVRAKIIARASNVEGLLEAITGYYSN